MARPVTGAVPPGGSAPQFFLQTPSGVEVSLSACLLEGPVVIEFVRGSWDPDARRRLGELGGRREEFRSLGARLVIIVCERAAQLAAYLSQHPTPLTLLADEDRTTARAYGVLQRFSLPVWNVARPSTFVVDRCGFVRYAYVARLRIHAAPIDEVLAAVRHLEGANKA